MNLKNRLQYGWKAIRQLGWKTIKYYIPFQVGMRIGYYRWATPLGGKHFRHVPDIDWSVIPVADEAQLSSLPDFDRAGLLREAHAVCSGLYRPFGGEISVIRFDPAQLVHWTRIKESEVSGDIKWVWEPARMEWVYLLGRAYTITGDERYALSFWNWLEEFWRNNPVNQGANWLSAQEVALRLIAMAFGGRIFSGAQVSTPERMHRLSVSLYEHASRIPPTLDYARAQNNNHLISEAAGLWTAGILFHKQSWQHLGWKWLNWAIQTQIAEDGTYIQHSTNYHRFVLQTVLWVAAVGCRAGVSFPQESQERLRAATTWLWGCMDKITGMVSNTGHNDGSYIQPLAGGGHADYRPVVQAAFRAFYNRNAFLPGKWDELSVWLGFDAGNGGGRSEPQAPGRINSVDGWASLRTAYYSARPAQADQLHVDIWWRGFYLARDAGTYAYNLPAPWNNSLGATRVHNTVEVNGCSQMQHASRFLWLDWAQAHWLETNTGSSVSAEHDGYQNMGIYHRRRLEQIESGWLISDTLLPSEQSTTQETSCWLHWLLPDVPYVLEDSSLVLELPSGRCSLTITSGKPFSAIQLLRAGTLVAGDGNGDEILGWYSPTYGVREPALSFRVHICGRAPLQMQSRFELWRI